MAIFIPSPHAAYARLNALLPPKVTREVLRFLCPSDWGSHGFPAYYDKCTIREFSALGGQNGLEVLSIHRYYCSNYLGIFFPVYVIRRLALLLSYVIDLA